MTIVFVNDKCQKLADVIAEHTDVNFVYHPAKCEMVNEGFSYVTNPIEPQEISVERILLANKIGGMPMIGVKKSCFAKLADYRPHFVHWKTMISSWNLCKIQRLKRVK